MLSALLCFWDSTNSCRCGFPPKHNRQNELLSGRTVSEVFSLEGGRRSLHIIDTRPLEMIATNLNLSQTMGHRLFKAPLMDAS